MNIPYDNLPLNDMNLPIDVPQTESEGDDMNARIHVKPSEIAHAMAYVDTFLMSSDPDECELRHIFEKAHTLSSQEVVLIIKESAKRCEVFGIKTILREMEKPEFEQYINRKLNLFRESLMDD